MTVGILSDTHGNVPRTREATRILLDQGATRLIHCGDIGSEDVLYAIASAIEGSDIDVQAVRGNVDEWDQRLQNFPLGLGIEIRAVWKSSWEGIPYAIAHGHDTRAYLNVLEDQEIRLVFTGHTHVARDHMEGHVRVINPGAVHRATTPSVAVFDPANESLRYFKIS